MILKNLISNIGYALVLVCEYLPSDLWEMMRSNAKPLSPRHIKSYLWMLVNAIDYIHGLGIMHRDLKPANLLIGPDGKHIFKHFFFSFS